MDSLDGIGEFDWATTPLTYLHIYDSQISSIEAGAFDGLTNLTILNLWGNQISSIEAGDFAGVPNLKWLNLGGNQISSIEADDLEGLPNLEMLSLRGNEISRIESGSFRRLRHLTQRYLDRNRLTKPNLDDADFSSLTIFSLQSEFDVRDNLITGVSLKNAVVNQTSLARLMDGGEYSECGFAGFLCTGIGDLHGITNLDLSGVDFADITDLAPLYVMDDLTDLWLADTLNMDATDLDVLLDNLETIEGTDTEGVLYLTQSDFDAFNTAGGGLLSAWNAEPGHHVAIIPEPTSVVLMMLASVAISLRRQPRRLKNEQPLQLADCLSIRESL